MRKIVARLIATLTVEAIDLDVNQFDEIFDYLEESSLFGVHLANCLSKIGTWRKRFYSEKMLAFPCTVFMSRMYDFCSKIFTMKSILIVLWQTYLQKLLNWKKISLIVLSCFQGYRKRTGAVWVTAIPSKVYGMKPWFETSKQFQESLRDCWKCNEKKCCISWSFLYCSHEDANDSCLITSRIYVGCLSWSLGKAERGGVRALTKYYIKHSKSSRAHQFCRRANMQKPAILLTSMRPWCGRF